MKRERIPFEVVVDTWGRVVPRFLFCPWCGNEIDKRAKGRHARWHHKPENCWTEDEIVRAKLEGFLSHVLFTANERDFDVLTALGYERPFYATQAELEAISALLKDPPPPTEALIKAVGHWKGVTDKAKSKWCPECGGDSRLINDLTHVRPCDACGNTGLSPEARAAQEAKK